MSLKKLGRYDLIRVLGKGAMGMVYEGRDPNLDRRVAIKTIRVENLSEEAAAEYEHRFRVEARSAARLQHPNIVSVYDSDRDGDMAFLVMEFIQGEDLKHHLDQGKRYSLSQTVEIMVQLLSALDYAHRQNIVHRDIKPANLLIEADGRVKLADFGVARIQDSGEATRTLGTMVGTLKYMSPEQVQGRPVDARADLFAAGIVLYQLLTGRRPFDGDSDFAVIQQVIGHSPAAPSSVNPSLPAAIDAVVAAALAKSRKQRFATALEFSAALQAASREASDLTVIAPASPPRQGSSASWTGTVAPGEALVGLQSDLAACPATVTQELELVYWKDIKESADAQDIWGFLAKFPSGIYADLARRRLRNLGALTGDDSMGGSRPGTGTRLMPRSATQLEKTTFAPRAGREIARPAVIDSANAQRIHLFEETITQTQDQPSAQGAIAEAVTTVAARQASEQSVSRSGSNSTVSKNLLALPSAPVAAAAPSGAVDGSPPVSGSRRWAWGLVGVVALAGAGLGARFLSTSQGTTALQAAALADPGSVPVAALPARAEPVVPTTPVAVASVPALGAAEVSLVPADAPAKVASVKKSANDKKAPVKSAAAKAVTVAAAHAESLATSPTAVTSPRQACESRMLIAFQVCMAEQCAKPAFTHHPLCAERRAMEQRRFDADLSR